MTQLAVPPQRQHGLTLWGWLYVLATLGVILLVGIKSLPIYMNNYAIASAVEWAANQPELRDAPAFEIQNRIQRRFDSGYVDNVRGRDIKVTRVDGGRRLRVRYQVREPLFGDVSLLFDFEETAFVPVAR